LSAESTWLAGAFLLVALLYGAVGQAGASGYLAVMSFASLAPAAMKTTALALNLAVAAIATLIFQRAERLSRRSVWPFAALGFPFSLLGGAVQLPEQLYFRVVGLLLLLSAALMLRAALRRTSLPPPAAASPPFPAALATGALIGFLSGTTGTGGGVFLAPVLIGLRWATPRQAAATTATFNLVNSAAALLGAFASWHAIPAALPGWLVAVSLGGALGAFAGSRYLPDRWLRATLALLLAVSGLRLLL
jgi:uncharacterized membrane protein YfcA